jgi:predicted ATP-binding protein involved in virulence
MAKRNLDQVRLELEELQCKQEKLQKYGLAEIKNVSYMFTLDKAKLDRFSAELSIYLEDVNAKYKVFESIINKLELYEKIVNQKLSFKKMILSSASGITVVSEEGKTLSLSELSSGEQEILVLFYKLIFEADVNLLLIDEPEISLHIAWQKEIMGNLKSVVNLNKKIQVIIATHSPQIISHNWDLQIDLGGIYNG